MPETKRGYRINKAAELTGVAPATLRAWERRYGIPVPRRTKTSYRLYTDDDIALVRRVRELCDDGLSPSEAAKAVLAEVSEHAVKPTSADDPLDPVRERILDATTAFDPLALERAVEESMALGSAPLIYDRIFRPVMLAIGDRWHGGELTVAQEHLVSQALESASAKLLGLIQPPDATRQVLLACFADEEHVLPLFGVGLGLTGAGFRVVSLGARTPPSAVRQAVEHLDPACVGLSVTVTPPLHEARKLVDDYGAACGSTPWLVGGRGAEAIRDLVEKRGGLVSDDGSPRELRRVVEGLLARKRTGNKKKRRRKR